MMTIFVRSVILHQPEGKTTVKKPREGPSELRENLTVPSASRKRITRLEMWIVVHLQLTENQGKTRADKS